MAEEKRGTLNKFIMPPQNAPKASTVTRRDAVLSNFLRRAKEQAKKLKDCDFSDDQVEEITEILIKAMHATIESRDIKLFTQDLVNTQTAAPPAAPTGSPLKIQVTSSR